MGETLYTFTITHKFPSLNEVISAAKKHWAVYAKMKREETALVLKYVQSMMRMGMPKFNHLQIRLVFYEKMGGRARDWDNITAAKKFILDGLVAGGCIADDSPKHIDAVYEQVIYSDDYCVRVELTGTV